MTMDEALLERLDADEEVVRDGRSAVIRRAIEAYLRRRRSARIRDAYAKGYAQGVSEELEGWGGEGSWPDD